MYRYRRSFLVLPQAGICADSFLFHVEEDLQRRTAGGEQQQQPRATQCDVSAALRFTVCRYVDIEFSMLSLPQWMPRGATRGFLLEHTALRLYMSLCSRDAFGVTDVVRI